MRVNSDGMGIRRDMEWQRTRVSLVDDTSIWWRTGQARMGQMFFSLSQFSLFFSWLIVVAEHESKRENYKKKTKKRLFWGGKR